MLYLTPVQYLSNIVLALRSNRFINPHCSKNISPLASYSRLEPPSAIPKLRATSRGNKTAFHSKQGSAQVSVKWSAELWNRNWEKRCREKIVITIASVTQFNLESRLFNSKISALFNRICDLVKTLYAYHHFLSKRRFMLLSDACNVILNCEFDSVRSYRSGYDIPKNFNKQIILQKKKNK